MNKIFIALLFFLVLCGCEKGISKYCPNDGTKLTIVEGMMRGSNLGYHRSCPKCGYEDAVYAEDIK